MVTKEFSWAHPFTATLPDNWEKMDGTGAPTLVLHAALDRWLQFTVQPPDGGGTWVERIETSPNIAASEPVAVDIGGVAGVMYDLDITERVANCPGEGGRCYLLIPSGSAQWVMVENRPNRAWIVELDGTEVLIITDAPDGAFDTWIAQVEASLATLTWSQ